MGPQREEKKIYGSVYDESSNHTDTSASSPDDLRLFVLRIERERREREREKKVRKKEKMTME